MVHIRSDHRREFENTTFRDFFYIEGIFHEFSAPLTPQQIGVVENKNRTLQEMIHIMLHAKAIPLYFWAKALNIACHIYNCIAIRSGTSMTNYDIWKGQKPNVSYFHLFGSKCHILGNRTPHRKRDSKAYSGLFLGYSTNN